MVAINGSFHGDEIDIRLIAGGSFSAQAWTFGGWTPPTDAISFIGTSGADTVTGSSMMDTFYTYGGVDIIHGGFGDDFFLFLPSDTARAGSTFDGGSGSDTIDLNAGFGGVGVYDFSTSTVTEMEILRALNSDFTAMLGSEQIGAGHIHQIVGNTANTQALIVSGASIDLSGVTFDNWGGAHQSITLNGTVGIDHLIGSSQNDLLNGGIGADTMQGGLGNDTYYVDNVGDHVIDVIGQGTDNVQAYVSFNLSGQELENLQLRTSASINGTGNSIANIINGNSGNNIIDGLGGADTISGAQGNDTYYVDNAGDHVVETIGQGIDNVQAYVSFNLSGQELENLQLRTSASINGTGNSIANIINGNSGNNIIDGLGGADTMSGAQGNDTYYVDNAGDHVIDVIGQGTDNVQAYVSFNLSGQELENLALRTSASINGTGNSIDNVINGNSGNNIINGLGGNDTLSGAQGQDSFVFTTALNASTNVDHITDFVVVEDTIQVDHAIFSALGGNGTLTADQFIKNTTGLAGDGNDHIIYETNSGWLYYDSNGSAAGGSTHFATLAANLALTNADFVVV
ncbi:calcium-binding protein [Mesorhizobium calcicola]|uniref:Calcium-binding protein n=1 Tax=Mesorhizobium calcicola TaxID=1300310 RepID=A0ABW4WQM3_9HYPH